MSKAYVEIDFFEMEKRNSASSSPSSVYRAPSSFRGIQSVVSRINPQLLKTVMAAGPAGCTRPGPREQLPLSSSSSSALPVDAEEPSQYSPPAPPLPVFNNTASRFSICPAATDTAPLTIFYNGTVTVFDVPRDKAEAIIRMAATGAVGDLAETVEDSFLDGKQLGGDLPMARRKSLQSFLAKRRQRFASLSPYDKVSSCGPCHNMWRCDGHKYA